MRTGPDRTGPDGPNLLAHAHMSFRFTCGTGVACTCYHLLSYTCRVSFIYGTMDGEANQSCSSSNNEAILPIIATKSDDFTPEEAAALLTSGVEEKTIAVPPCLPKAGEAYLFCPDDKRNTSKFNLHALTTGLYSHLVYGISMHLVGCGKVPGP